MSNERLPDEMNENPTDLRPEKVARSLELLFEPEQVVELRALNALKTVRGYYDDHAVLTHEAVYLEDRGYSVYVTLNEVNHALLARSANQARELYGALSTADGDIVRRRWLPLHFDPVRPLRMCATHEEKKAASELGKAVLAHLRTKGWPNPIIADSGNGFYFLYRVDLPNDRESQELVKGVQNALAAEFDNNRAKIDLTVHHAAQVVRLFGTMNLKGEHTEDRPYRRSKICKIPQGAPSMKMVTQEMLETIASRGHAYSSNGVSEETGETSPEAPPAQMNVAISHTLRGLKLLLEKHPEYRSESDAEVLIDAVMALGSMYFLPTLDEMVDAMKEQGMSPTSKFEVEVAMRRMQRAPLDPEGDTWGHPFIYGGRTRLLDGENSVQAWVRSGGKVVAHIEPPDTDYFEPDGFASTMISKGYFACDPSVEEVVEILTELVKEAKQAKRRHNTRTKQKDKPGS